VLQRAYLKVLERPQRFRGTSSFRTYVFGVIRRTAQEERRRLRLGWRRAGDPRAALTVVDPAARADVRAANAECVELLLRALQSLSQRQREVIELVFYHSCTIEEAARIMGVRVGSARTHYARAKERLRILLPGDL
jgi:RNA polymerase sigma factor (sigma-70 family)